MKRPKLTLLKPLENKNKKKSKKFENIKRQLLGIKSHKSLPPVLVISCENSNCSLAPKETLKSEHETEIEKLITLTSVTDDRNLEKKLTKESVPQPGGSKNVEDLIWNPDSVSAFPVSQTNHKQKSSKIQRKISRQASTDETSMGNAQGTSNEEIGEYELRHASKQSLLNLLPRHIDFGVGRDRFRRKYLAEPNLTQEMQNQIDELQQLNNELVQMAKNGSQTQLFSKHSHYEPMYGNRRFHKLWDSDSIDIPTQTFGKNKHQCKLEFVSSTSVLPQEIESIKPTKAAYLNEYTWTDDSLLSNPKYTLYEEIMITSMPLQHNLYFEPPTELNEEHTMYQDELTYHQHPEYVNLVQPQVEGIVVTSTPTKNTLYQTPPKKSILVSSNYQDEFTYYEQPESENLAKPNKVSLTFENSLRQSKDEILPRVSNKNNLEPIFWEPPTKAQEPTYCLPQVVTSKTSEGTQWENDVLENLLAVDPDLIEDHHYSSDLGTEYMESEIIKTERSNKFINAPTLLEKAKQSFHTVIHKRLKKVIIRFLLYIILLWLFLVCVIVMSCSLDLEDKGAACGKCFFGVPGLSWQPSKALRPV